MDLGKLFGNTLKQLELAKALSLFGLPSDFIEALKKGELFVPSMLIKAKVNQELSTFDGIELSDLKCDKSGIHLILEVQKYTANIELKVHIVVSDIDLNSDNQKIYFSYTQAKPVGKNVLGKIIMAIAESIISGMIDEQVRGNDMIINLTKEGKTNNAVIDLKDVSEVKRLQQNVPLINKSVLDFVNIDDIVHESGGIKIFIKSPLLKLPFK